VTETQIHRPTVGRDLVLECRPPKSYPSGNIYWGISRPGSNQLKAIDNDDRVVLGYDGRISFKLSSLLYAGPPDLIIIIVRLVTIKFFLIVNFLKIDD